MIGNYRLSLIFILFLCVSSAIAHPVSGNIKGIVISKENKKAIAYATVTLEGTTIGAVTNESGLFQFKVPVGKHKLNVSYVGYESYSQEITKEHLDSKQLNIQLTPTAIAIDDVVVKGKSQTRNTQEQGFAISSVDMQSSIASTFETTELLNRASGVKIRQSGGAGSNLNYSINGLTGNSVRVYIDGVPIRNYGPSFSLANIPPGQIEKVEVYKGVVPAEFADDALGGVINVILKKSSINTVNAAYSYGSYNTHKGDLNAQVRNQKSGLTGGFSLYYNYSDNNYDVWGDAITVSDPNTGAVKKDVVAERFHDNYEAIGVNANIGFSGVKWADNFRIDGNYSSVRKDIQHGATMATVYGERRSESESMVGNATYRKRNILPRFDIVAAASYSSADRMIIDTARTMYNWLGPILNSDGTKKLRAEGLGEAGEATLETNIERNITSRVNLRYALDKAEKHIFTANVMHSNFTRDVDDPLESAALRSLEDSRYVSKTTLSTSYDTKLLNDKLRSSLFYKYFSQNLTLSDPSLELDGTYSITDFSRSIDGSGYGLSLSYELVTDLFITLSGEKAIRLPGITELIGKASDNITANYSLDPENSTNFNLGTMIGPLDLGHRNTLSVNANLFYRDVKDMIERRSAGVSDDFSSYINIGQILSKGADFEFAYNYSRRLSITGAVSYTDARFNLQYNESGAEYIYYGDRLRNQPYFTANSEVKYTFNNVLAKGGRLSFNYFLNYTHEFFRDWESLGSANSKPIIPTQLTHDIGVVYMFPKDKISLSVDAKNILNEQVFDNYALQKPGRMVFFKLAYKIM